MTRPQEDKDREHRIAMEIVVDAYDGIERALSWYYYLDEHLSFPFKAKCIVEHPLSPLASGEIVEVIGMPPEEACEHSMFVTIKWQKREFAVPLSQLAGISIEARTSQAVEDWHYWVARGYTFS